MSEWIEIYINGEHSHDREIKFLPLNKHDIEKISNFHRHQCSDYGSFLIEIYLQNGPLIFSTEMPSQALSLKAAWIKCADKMPPDDTDLLAWHAAYQVPKLATYYADDGTFVEFGTGEDIGASHWMPLPDMPEVKE